MTNFKKNTRVLVIDRGWLEKQSVSEKSFLEYFQDCLINFEKKIYPESKIRIQFHIISTMEEVNKGKTFSKDKKKSKQQKIENYDALKNHYPYYINRLSTDSIKRINKRIDNLYVFIVYTESIEELEILARRYLVKGIIKFNEKPSDSDEDDIFKRIYINSTSEALKVSEQMPLFLFQDIKEIKPYFNK